MSPSSSPLKLDVHLFRRSQVSDLIAEEAFTKVSAEYSDFVDVFSLDLAFELLKHIGINNHAIKQVKGCQQLLYGPIYSLRPMELETLKTYIETNLANGFIRPFKLLTSTPILFDRKSDGFLPLSVNYQGFNNFTIKNRYPLSLIEESLDRLERARWFISLDFTSVYHQRKIRKGDECKTAFRTQYNYFEYQVMPFGLTNASASFQRYINKIFAKKLDIFVIVHLDDIFIYTNDDGDGHVIAIR